MLFADLRHAEKGGTADRRFMRRTGEMLYLMLGRSETLRRERMTELLKERLISRETPWNDLARHIGGTDDPGASADSVDLRTGYLPIRHLGLYDQLASDWISILSLRRTQIEDLLDPLMRISALHLIIYLLYRSRHTTGLSHPGRYPPFIFDLAPSGADNPVRRMSREQYWSHVKLPMKAIDSYFDQFSASDFWPPSKTTPEEKSKALDTLNNMFLWSDNSAIQPDAILEELRANALRSNHSIWSTIANLASGSGMSIRRRGVGTWYAPDSDFLEALVLANVEEPMELGTFLERLFQRYRIVIGPQQAILCFGDKSAFLESLKDNEGQLEVRLRTSGFLDRKSDACAFVKNPFYEGDQ